MRSSRLFALAGLLTMASATTATAAEPEAIALAELHGYALGLTDADQFSGVVLVARGDSVLFERAYGKRDSVKDDPVTIDTRFNLASAGKMFTAVAILQLVAANRISLDTPVGDVLRDYANRDFARSVTVRHLLTHTAGAGDIDELFGAESAAKRQRLTSHAAMVALHHGRPPAFPAGSKQAYGNFGFLILGRMVETLSGERFEAYVRRHIFAPAGMTRTSFEKCSTALADLAVGYATAGGKRVANCATQPTRGMAAGGEISTARDMWRFTRALEQGKFIPQALFAEATHTHREFMGLGFFATDYGPDVPARDFRWGHGGSSDGVCTDVRTYPRTGETIIVLTNRDPPACFPVAGFLHRQWKERAPK